MYISWLNEIHLLYILTMTIVKKTWNKQSAWAEWSPTHLHRYLKNYTSTQCQEIKIIASYNVSFYKRLFFPLWHEALKRVSTEIWSFFLWKELLRLQTFFILMERKIIAEMISLLQRLNSRLEYVHQTKIRRNKMFSSSDNINISTASSVEIHLLAELTVDFTVLQISLQVTDKIISKVCMEISNIFWVFSRIGAAYWSWLYLVTKVGSVSCGKCYIIFQTELRLQV